MTSIDNSLSPEKQQAIVAGEVKPPKPPKPDPKDRRQIDRAAELKRQEQEAKARG